MPRRKQFDLIVPGSPGDVARRLRAQTRWRLLPYQGSLLGRGGLGGRISASGFRVSLDQRDWLQRMTAVASGSLEDRGDGTTRIRGVASLPTWATWYLRAISVVLPLFAATAIGLGIAEGSPDLLVLFSTFTAGVLIMLPAIGWNVAHANDQVDPLVDHLTQALTAADPPQAVAEAEGAAASRRQAAARAAQTER